MLKPRTLLRLQSLLTRLLLSIACNLVSEERCGNTDERRANGVVDFYPRTDSIKLCRPLKHAWSCLPCFQLSHSVHNLYLYVCVYVRVCPSISQFVCPSFCPTEYQFHCPSIPSVSVCVCVCSTMHLHQLSMDGCRETGCWCMHVYQSPLLKNPKVLFL